MAGKNKKTVAPGGSDEKPAEKEPKLGDEEMLKGMVAELKYLRFLFQEVNASYEARIEAEIEQVIDSVETIAAGRLNKEKRNALQSMLKNIENVKEKVKIKKGRRKDVLRLDDLVGGCSLLMEKWN